MKGYIIENLKTGIKMMAFKFEIMYIKANPILHVDALSIQDFVNEKLENHKNAEDKILHREDMDVALLNLLRIETK